MFIHHLESDLQYRRQTFDCQLVLVKTIKFQTKVFTLNVSKRSNTFIRHLEPIFMSKFLSFKLQVPTKKCHQ